MRTAGLDLAKDLTAVLTELSEIGHGFNALLNMRHGGYFPWSWWGHCVVELFVFCRRALWGF